MHIYEYNPLPMTSLHVSFGYGSLYEPRIGSGLHGIPHLIEHLTVHALDPILSELDAGGITRGADTRDTSIVFSFSGLSSRLTADLKRRIVNLLSAPPVWSEDMFTGERGVVECECRSAYADPVRCLCMDAYRELFAYASTTGIIQEIAGADMKTVYDLCVLHAARPVCIAEVGPEKTDFTGTVDFAPLSMPEPLTLGKYDVPFATVPSNGGQWGVVAVGTRLIPRDDMYAAAVASDVIGGEDGSPLFSRLRSGSGLVYFMGCSVCSEAEGARALITALSPDPDGVRGILDDALGDMESLATDDRIAGVIGKYAAEGERRGVLRYSDCQDLTCGGFAVPDYSKMPSSDDVFAAAEKYFGIDSMAVRTAEDYN